MSRLLLVSNCLSCIFCEQHGNLVEPNCKVAEKRRIFDVPIATIPQPNHKPIPDWCPLPIEVKKS